MRSLLKIALGIAALVVAFGAGWLVAITGTGQAIPLESLSELERGFAERMQNVVLTGHYTLKGRERRDDKPERYEITRVAKVGEHRWRFDVHMTYGSVDMTLPVVVPIRWAGDTPIVTITDMVIPGLDGTFTARVMFYAERYAGSWQHGEYGGLMYGTIAPLSDYDEFTLVVAPSLEESVARATDPHSPWPKCLRDLASCPKIQTSSGLARRDVSD